MIDDIRSIISGKFVGITGGAGSGKSTLATRLGFTTYSIDVGFFGDSEYRKEILGKKSTNHDSFVDSCNMYNWWNWESIEKEIFRLMSENKTMVVEGALLGTEWLLNQLDHIFFLYDSPENRFAKLVTRDSYKRSFNELIDRFLITEYSESLYYKRLFEMFYRKIFVIDTNYEFLNFFPYIDDTYSLPLKVKI